MPEARDMDAIRRILTTSRVVAVLGAHPDTDKPAHFVPAYLHEQGFEVHPVNPTYPGERLWGRSPVARLADLEGPVDVVDVFRRSEHLSGHLDDLLAMDPLPKVVWFQKGIRHDEVAGTLEERGVQVVQDACMLALHKKRGLQRVMGPDAPG